MNVVGFVADEEGPVDGVGQGARNRGLSGVGTGFVEKVGEGVSGGFRQQVGAQFVGVSDDEVCSDVLLDESKDEPLVFVFVEIDQLNRHQMAFFGGVDHHRPVGAVCRRSDEEVADVAELAVGRVHRFGEQRS